MSSIIEKLEIEPISSYRNMCPEQPVRKLEQQKNDLLKALINYHKRDEIYLESVDASFEMWNKITPVIEKIAGLSWSKIKELNNG